MKIIEHILSTVFLVVATAAVLVYINDHVHLFNFFGTSVIIAH